MSEPIVMYGLRWPPPWRPLEIELSCFAHGTKSRGGESDNRPHHFKQVVKMLWGPKCKKHFVWNPWNEKMLEEACIRKWLSLSGCAGSQKTDFLSVWGLVNWACMPLSTGVLMTSTSLSESRQRIWGRVEEYFMAASDKNGNPLLPGKLISSRGRLKTFQTGVAASDRSGLHLIPGDRSKEKENIGKIIGFHNKRVIFLCDEMPELSPALTEAAQSNLIVNPYFQFIAAGNFKSIYDPFGIMASPKDGWGSVTPEHDEWETINGKCLRFDGLKSPNILAGRKLYPGMYSTEDLEEHRKGLGEHSAGFWRMCRSFPCPEADANRIYSEADFLKGDAMGTVKWIQPPVSVASLDPAFATGGDKAIARFGLLGTTAIPNDDLGPRSGKMTLLLTERLELREDIRIKDENRALQVAKLFRDACVQRRVEPENAAFDGSGGGIVFGSLLTEIWSPKLLAVQFGGSASQRPVSSKDNRPAKDVCTNRVTELWFAGVDFFHSGQIKGLDNYAAIDLTERRYDTTKGTSGLKLKAEKKEEMKSRMGRSPDDGDAFLILLELCRERLGFMADGMEGKRVIRHNSFKRRAELTNRIYSNVAYESEAA